MKVLNNSNLVYKNTASKIARIGPETGSKLNLQSWDSVTAKSRLSQLGLAHGVNSVWAEWLELARSQLESARWANDISSSSQLRSARSSQFCRIRLVEADIGSGARIQLKAELFVPIDSNNLVTSATGGSGEIRPVSPDRQRWQKSWWGHGDGGGEI